MRVAFYAPLKPPDHPTPSGDRRVAQLFFAALRLAGHDVFVASRFRSYEGRGDKIHQARLESLGAILAERFLSRCLEVPETAPELWFTYHLYHKAPDWLGPPIADRLDIPYLLAEASDAPKQALGKWAAGRDAAQRAIRRADAVIGLNPTDRECVLALLRDPRRWVAIKPFLDAASFGPLTGAALEPPRLIAIAMMRYGDKLASYRILGDALSRLLDLSWSLEVVGDGPARSAVEDALDSVRERVIWLGVLDASAIRGRLGSADLFVWPAVNEALGMALLEAQASGLPVVAGRAGGVGEVVVSEMTGLLVPPGDVLAFAAAVRSLIIDQGRRAAFAKAAQNRARAEHDLAIAARRLADVIDAVRLTRCARA
jgi:glycosyltransferase involved in cell wall biosynthesis